MSENHKASGDVQTTGHLWDDDLADFVNPPPKWWMLGLTASGIWVVVYWLMYPAIPVAMAGVYFKGFGLPGLNLHLPGTDASQDNKWTAIKELAIDQKELDDVRKPYEDKLKDMTPAQILADGNLSEYVARSGKVLFSDNCAACHGQNGVGTIQAGKFAEREKGLMAPMLNDDDWLYGGQINTIHETIVGGRQAMMTPHKDMLSEQQIGDVAAYVKAMSEEGKDAADFDEAVAAGKKVFAESDCTACHGADARGVQAMGSANLTDKIWRFDGSIEGIKQTITYGVNAGDNARVAVMPNFTAGGKLSAVEMKKLAVYVYKFGGGVPDAVEVVAPVEEKKASKGHKSKAKAEAVKPAEADAGVALTASSDLSAASAVSVPAASVIATPSVKFDYVFWALMIATAGAFAAFLFALSFLFRNALTKRRGEL